MNPFITINQVDPKGPKATVWLGDGFVVPTVSGGWQSTQRARDRAIAEWQGQDLITMDVPILIDQLESEIDIEPQISTLFGFMRNIVGTRSEPPVLRITGVPVPFANLDWVLNGIQPGEEVRRSNDGKRIRAAMSLSLLEYREGDVVTSKTSSPAKTQQQKSSTSSSTSSSSSNSTATSARTYTVKKGDTLSGIAAKLLGNANRWHDIANLNNIRDPNVIQIGQVLKIPSQ